MMSNVVHNKRVASDKDKFIIGLMKEVQNGWTPPTELSESKYQELKTLSKENRLSDGEIALIGFAGYGCSFGGKWFAGMARGGVSSKGVERNHVAESCRNLVRMRPQLRGIDFHVSEYHSLVIPNKSVIYNDPPYSTGTKYKSDFDHTDFWNWVREVSKSHFVFTSEYNAPEDFHCIWEKSHKVGIDHSATTHKITVEKLFVHKDGLSYIDNLLWQTKTNESENLCPIG